MAEEIVAKLRFVVVGQKDVANAIKQLDKVQGIQRTVVTETGRATKEGLVSSKTIEATAKVSSAAYDKQRKTIEKVVTAVGNYKGAVSATYSMQKKTAPAVTTHTQRFAGSMAGLAVATALAAQRMGPLRVTGLHTAGAFATLGLVGIRVSQAFNASRMAGEKWTAAAGRMRRNAWTVTWAAMSMLGVFFGGFTVLRLFRRALEMLLRPFQDFTALAERVGTAFAYATITGIGPFAGQVQLIPEIMMTLLEASFAVQAVLGTLTTMFLLTAAAIFQNPEVLELLNTLLFAMKDALVVLTPYLVEFAIGALSIVVALVEDKDKMLGLLDALRSFLSIIISVALSVFFFLGSLTPLKPIVDELRKAIEAQDTPWGKFGAMVASLIIVLAGAAVVAMILLPILSLFQVVVLATSGIMALFGIAVKIGTGLMTLFSSATIASIAPTLGLVAAFAVIFVSFGYLIYAIATAKDSLSLLNAVIGAVIATVSTVAVYLLITAGILTGPVGIAILAVIVGLSALITYFGGWGKLVETVNSSLRTLWEKIGGIVTIMFYLINPVGQAIFMFKGLVKVLDLLTNALGRVKEKLFGSPETIFSLAAQDARVLRKELLGLPAVTIPFGVGAGIGAGVGAVPAPIQYSTIYQSVSIGSIEKTADVDTVIGQLAQIKKSEVYR